MTTNIIILINEFMKTKLIKGNQIQSYKTRKTQKYSLNGVFGAFTKKRMVFIMLI
jgi:hypothetical protein